MQPDNHLQPQSHTHTLPTMASVMTWEDKIVGDSFKNIINATIKHLNKNNALKISEGEALELFNLPAKKQAASVLRQDATPQEKAMAIMAKYLKKRSRSAKTTIRQSFRAWSKETEKARKQAEKDSKKAEKQAELEAQKQAKKDEREAKKAEKQAELEAQKQAKKDAREAKKAEKLAELEAQKQAKKDAREAKKAEKQALIAQEKAEAKAANDARKVGEKEAKKAEREAKKAEKAKKVADEKEAKKLAMANVPCDKCFEGSGKMMGHRGRHTLEPKCEPCSPQSESKDDGDFVECPKCPPGSGKKKGHRGKCKGAKKKKTAKEESSELNVDDLMGALALDGMGSGNEDELEKSDSELDVEKVVASVLDSDSDSDDEKDEHQNDTEAEGGDDDDSGDELSEEMKVTIDGVDYYKVPHPIDGLENPLFNYPDGDECMGSLHADGVTFIPLDN